jgi:lysophospholipase L1-like esterase
MSPRVLRPALLLALLFACNSGSSSNGGDDGSPSTSNPGTEPGGNGGAGSTGGPSSSSGATSSSGGGSSGGSSSGGQNVPLDPGPPHVQFIGRFDKTDPNAPRCSYGGCRIVARFDGTTVKAKLQEQFYSWMEAAPSEWDVIVDGQTKDKLVMSAAETEFVLATGLPQGAHIVELYKRSEPQTGTTQFKGFDFGGGTLLSPPARKQRRIEIVGDSSSTGYGVEGVGLTDPATGKCPGANHAAKYENFRKAYGAVLGTLVDAEVYSTSLSGKGIYQNIWSEDADTLPTMFLRTLPMDQKTATWNFAEWKPDVVIVMAGGNDFAIRKPVDTGPATVAQFTDAYRQLVGKMRTEYPQAHLVLTVSPTTDDNEPVGSNTRTNISTGAQTVATERNAQGDAKVYFFAPNKAPKSEMTGCYGHGSPEYHQRVAKEFEAYVKPKLGW